jgi:site-specific DNA recombinase
VSGFIEDVVWADVKNLLRNPGNVLQQFQAHVLDQAGEADRFRKQAADLQQGLQAQSKERDLVVGLFRKGRINGGTLDRQLDQIQQEEAGLKDAIAALTAKAREAEEAATQLRSAEDKLRALYLRLDEPLTWELKRQLIESLVESIVVETIGDESLPQKDKRAIVIMKYRFGSTQKVELAPVETRKDTGS